MVGAIIKAAMNAAELNIETVCETWHTEHDVRERKREYAAWLAKADELEEMR